MTDKELRKLSRLELLELLLEASKENEKLKEEIEKLKIENKTAQNIENLSVATHKIETALRYANNITDNLKGTSGEYVAERVIKEKEEPIKAKPLSDKEIYRRILSFFAKNDEKLNVFPSDLENDIRDRIKSILERMKTN